MKIAIATTFYEMDQQYSLVSVVRDRYELLTKHGHDVEVWVQEDFTGNDYGMNVVNVMPRFNFFDYQNSNLKPEDIPNVEKVRLAISNQVSMNHIEAVYVEDLMFQGWFYVHNLAIREVAKEFPDIRWFAVAHSIPSGMKSIWTPLPLGSKVIALNENIAMHCAENYRTTVDNVHVIYNSMDFRTYTEKDPLSIDIYERYELMNADIIQIYPFSSERWIDKGVDKLLHIFSCLKQLGNNVKLVLVTAWQFPESIKEIRKKAREFGLTESEAIITSEAYPNRVGMPNRVVRELMQISNLFVFPTRAEASPLILGEAMMAGCYVVINDLLPQLLEIAGNSVRKFHLNSSVHHQHQNADENTFYLDVAKIIDAEMRINPIVKTKNKVRKEFCFEYLYRTQYAPLLNAPPSYEVTRLAHA
jgi:glycosyltransferase involved in cell wall biosynthesis